MKNTALKIVLLFACFYLYPSTFFAQDPDFPESPDGGADPLPGASIDQHIYILAAIASVLAVYFMNKRSQEH